MPRTRKPSISPEDYRAFVTQIELQRIVLSSGTIQRFRFPSYDTALRYEEKTTKRDYIVTDMGFDATQHFLVRLQEDGKDEPFGEIRVAFTACYTSKREMADDVFEVFSDLNLPINVYPYIREFVHSATNKMGFPGLLLPTLKRG